MCNVALYKNTTITIAIDGKQTEQWKEGIKKILIKSHWIDTVSANSFAWDTQMLYGNTDIGVYSVLESKEGGIVGIL